MVAKPYYTPSEKVVHAGSDDIEIRTEKEDRERVTAKVFARICQFKVFIFAVLWPSNYFLRSTRADEDWYKLHFAYIFVYASAVGGNELR